MMKKTFPLTRLPAFEVRHDSPARLPVYYEDPKRSSRWRLPRPWSMVRLLIIAISVLGFLLQVTIVSRQYFHYDTTTSLEHERPRVIRHRAIALCIRFADLMDSERLERETGIRWKGETEGEDEEQEALEKEGKLTTRQIFAFTPNASALIASCFYRLDDWSYERSSNASRCASEFTVERFLTLEFICYKTAEAVLRPIKVSGVTLSTFHTTQIFQISLSDVIGSRARVVQAIAFRGGLPFNSRRRAAVTFLEDEADSRTTLFVSATETMTTLLAAPYDTACVRKPETRLSSCLKECELRRMAVIARVPPWHLILESEASDLKMLSYKDLKDERMLALSRAAFDACEKECAFTPCIQKSTTAFVETSVSKRATAAALSVVAVSSRQPDTIVTAVATMSTVDYFSFLGSCFGFWFGASVLSVDLRKTFACVSRITSRAKRCCRHRRRRVLPQTRRRRVTRVHAF